ncbi:hypothetical protein ABZ070_28960 [Streptomyces sp. NPDC006283]|uniref:hypothetical protein n=1 Tax=Streptomyces sp. NPDC006283 TaxID=3156741 RepID=UPI0033AB749D
MSASEREAQSSQQSSEPAVAAPQPAALSMRELLASCAAASAVSTPPRQAPRASRETPRPRQHRDAA